MARRSRDAAALDRMAASRMHVAQHVALTVGPSPILLRWKLRRLGMDMDSEEVKALLLALVDDLGTQKDACQTARMTRYVAVEEKSRSKNLVLIL